jgi:hypothetical protein
MRSPLAIRLLLAAFVLCQSHAATFGQSTPIDPLKVKICELVREPARFAGGFVQFRSEFVSRFQWEGVVDESCSAKIQVGVFHVLDDLKPEQGEYAFTTLSDDNTHPERLDWKPIELPRPVHLKLDDNYRKFRRYADTKFKWPDGGVCQDCPLYRIEVKAVARFDYFETQTVAVRANSQTKAFGNSAGDDPNAPLLRFVLQSIEDVSATPVDPATYSNQRQRDVTPEEADALVTAFFKDRGNTKLPSFGLEKYTNPYFPQFLCFQGIFDNPGGSVNLGFYAVDRKTGEVWDGVYCARASSPSLVKLQAAIRNRIGLARDEYRKERRPGPMCDPDEKPPLERAK